MGTTLGHIVVQGKGVFLYRYSIPRKKRFWEMKKIKKVLKMLVFCNNMQFDTGTDLSHFYKKYEKWDLLFFSFVL